jgi:hypothetical protein
MITTLVQHVRVRSRRYLYQCQDKGPFSEFKQKNVFVRNFCKKGQNIKKMVPRTS